VTQLPGAFPVVSPLRRVRDVGYGSGVWGGRNLPSAPERLLVWVRADCPQG